jgi:hypothetical protein
MVAPPMMVLTHPLTAAAATFIAAQVETQSLSQAKQRAATIDMAALLEPIA